MLRKEEARSNSWVEITSAKFLYISGNNAITICLFYKVSELKNQWCIFLLVRNIQACRYALIIHA